MALRVSKPVNRKRTNSRSDKTLPEYFDDMIGCYLDRNIERHREAFKKWARKVPLNELYWLTEDFSATGRNFCATELHDNILYLNQLSAHLDQITFSSDRRAIEVRDMVTRLLGSFESIRKYHQFTITKAERISSSTFFNHHFPWFSHPISSASSIVNNWMVSFPAMSLEISYLKEYYSPQNIPGRLDTMYTFFKGLDTIVGDVKMCVDRCGAPPDIFETETGTIAHLSGIGPDSELLYSLFGELANAINPINRESDQ